MPESFNIFNPEEDPALKSQVFSLDDLCPSLQIQYRINPYYVLGISALASKKDALDASAKLEKYNKLGIQAKYTGSFDLAGVSAPARDIGIIQNAMNHVDQMEYRWLWFSDIRFPKLWNRSVLAAVSEKNGQVTYNEFLACLFHCFISDPDYRDSDKWEQFFALLDDILLKDDQSLFIFIQNHVTENDLKTCDYHMLVRSFRDTIINFLTTNIARQSISANCNLYALACPDQCCFSRVLSYAIAAAASDWVTKETSIISDITDEVKNTVPLCYLNTQKIYSALLAFDIKGGFRNLEKIAEMLSSLGELQGEIMREKVRSVVWEATNVLAKGGHKKIAAKYDSKIYRYCDDKQKKQIKNVYPLDSLDLPDSEFTAVECETEANRFECEKNYEKAFKWRLKAAEKGSAASMNSVGVAYATGNGVEKDEEKAVAWYQKAVEKNEPYALENLASRYLNGSLPGGKTKAKEYLIRAFIYRPRENVKTRLNTNFPGWEKEPIPLLTYAFFQLECNLIPVAEAGVLHAQYLLGMYYHNGKALLISKDERKAKAWLMKAAKAGFTDAQYYLQKEFGITTGPVIFRWDHDARIVSGVHGVNIDFCGIKTKEDGYYIAFWVDNYGSEDRTIWIKNCSVNGESCGFFERLGDFGAYGCHYGYYKLAPKNAGDMWEISLQIELDEKGTTELCTFSPFNFTLDFRTSTIQCSHTLLKIGKEKPVTYSEVNFQEKIIYNNGLLLKFCGVNLDADRNCNLKFWVESNIMSTICISAAEIVVDEFEPYKNAFNLGKFGSSARAHSGITIPDIDPSEEHEITMNIEVSNACGRELFKACRLIIELDGAGGVDIYSKVLGAMPSEFTRANQSRRLNTPGSYYSLNPVNNEIEIHFRQMPDEFVINTLQQSGWRWSKPRDCWYIKNSGKDFTLAIDITGGAYR